MTVKRALGPVFRAARCTLPARLSATTGSAPRSSTMSGAGGTTKWTAATGCPRSSARAPRTIAYVGNDFR